MDFKFELATPDDDPAIRRLLAQNPIPGRVTVTYEREPNYFWGCQTMGHFCQTAVVRHGPAGEVVGLGCRATRRMFVNGEIEEVGYLGQLRVDKHFQGRWLVPYGFRFLHQLHADRRVNGYITTIIEGNVQAQGILVTRARRHFPLYQEVERLYTLAIIVRNSPRFALLPQNRRAQPSYEISRGSSENLKNIVAFLQHHGAAKQFFPVYTEADFDDSNRTRDFKIDDFFLAHHQGKLVGVMGLWDQSTYKQTVVQSYSGALGRLRPLYNLGLQLIGAQPLPSPGQQIRFAYASFICIADNNPDVFRVLLRHVYHLATERGYTYLMIGLSERDPLLAIARQYFHIPYHSRLYTVCWKDEVSFHEKLDRRIPYVEIVAL